MKNNLFDKKFALLLLTGTLLAGTSGCSSRKLAKIKRLEEKEIVQLHTDSLLVTHRKETSAQHFGYWQQIRLSAPDSTGRQYVRSVTQAVNTSNRTALRQDSVVNNSTTAGTWRQSAKVEQVKENRRTSAGWRWLAVIICMSGIIASVRYFKSRTIS